EGGLQERHLRAAPPELVHERDDEDAGGVVSGAEDEKQGHEEAPDDEPPLALLGRHGGSSPACYELPRSVSGTPPERAGSRRTARGSPAGGVASSTSTLRVPFGWRKQIMPARPGRGASSMSGRPFARAAASSASTPGVSKQTWWSPSPRRSRNLATPPWGSIGSSSSISLRPMGRRAARTP